MQKYIDVQGFCGATGLSRATLERWLRREDIQFPRPVMVGRKRLWPEQEVRQFLDGQRAA